MNRRDLLKGIAATTAAVVALPSLPTWVAPPLSTVPCRLIHIFGIDSASGLGMMPIAAFDAEEALRIWLRHPVWSVVKRPRSASVVASNGRSIGLFWTE